MSSYSRRRGTNSGIAQKAPVRCATTANIVLSGFQTIDSATPTTNQHPRLLRVLVKNQDAPAQNGIYEMQTGTWQRTADFNSTEDFSKGTRVAVTDGATQVSEWVVTSTINPDSFQWDVDPITFADALTVDYSGVLSPLDIGVTVQAWDADLDQFAALTPTNNSFLVGDGTDWTLESGATARATLGLTIGTDVQPWDAQLDLWAAETPADYYDAVAVDTAINAAANALLADLASNLNGEGASLIGIYDAAGDYTATTVEGALVEVMDALQAHVADASDAHDASAISVAPSGSLAADDVQEALLEILGDVEAHVADASAAHAASAISFSPTGSISATDAQAAIAELGTEKQPLDATLTALAGVTVAADQFIYATDADAFAAAGFTSVARTLVAQTTQALMRTTGLGLSANGSSLVSAADYAAMRALLDLEVGTDFYSIAAASEEVTSFYSVSTLETRETAGGAVAAGMKGNGIYDGFSALTYVDVAGATNLDSGTAGELKPALSSGSQAGLDTMANLAFNTNSAGWSGFNFIQYVPAAQLSRSGTKLRFRLRGPSTGSTIITGMRFEHQAAAGDVYDAAGTPVAVTVASAANFTLATSADTWSDWITFAYDETKSLVIKMHFDATSTLRANLGAASGFNYYTKSGATEVATADVTGYTTGVDGRAFVIEQIQVASPQDLDVKSSAITLSAAPSWVELYAFVAPDTATLNTDLIFSATRNSSAYQTLTMTERYTRLDATKVYSSGRTTFSSTTGTSGRWRIQTDNDKLPIVKAVGVLFGPG